MRNICKGRYGEAVAKKYLYANGYKIICTNWTCRWGEIDIIAEKQNVIYFVEVKYRTSLAHGNPWESITRHKKRSLARAVRYFISSTGLHRRDQITYRMIGIFIYSSAEGRTKMSLTEIGR